MSYTLYLLIIVKFVSFILGMTIAFLTYKVGRRNKDRFMINLSGGFSLIAIGTLIELILNGLELDINLVHLIESIILIIGLGIIAYTLILKE